MSKIGKNDQGFFVDQDFLPAFHPLTGGKIRKSGRGERIVEVRLLRLGKNGGKEGHRKVAGIKEPGHPPLDGLNLLPLREQAETAASGIFLETRYA